MFSGPTVPNVFGLGAVTPLLQREDGSFVGTYTDASLQTDMVAFNSSGSILWTVPNETPQIATADGGVIGRSGTTYDQSGNATGQGILNGNTLPGWLGNVLGTAYSAQGNAVVQVVGPYTSYATTFAAFAGGNESSNLTAINQSLSGIPPSSAEQLPDLSSAACKIPRPVCGNINAIELLTPVSPDTIFQTMIQTFAPNLPDAQPKNTIQTFTNAFGGVPINVTGPGKK